MANGVYNRGKYLVGQTNLSGLTLHAMLVTTGYTFNQDHNTIDDGTTDDPKSYEITVSGYSRQALASITLNEDDSNDFSYLDAADISTFGNLAAGQTVGWAILTRYSSSGGTTSDTGQDLVSYYELTATPTNGGAIGLTWASSSAGGVLKLGTTS